MPSSSAFSIIWDENFWLPENTTWADLRSTATVKYPQFFELSYAVVVGACLLVLRLLVESFVYLPIGYAFGWIDTSKGLFKRIVDHLNFGFMAHQSRFRRVAETAWRFTFYTSIWVIGIMVISKQPQFREVDECWRNWPNHPISNGVWWYFIVEAGFYWSLLFSTFVIDVRRSDFWQMMLHHFVTILLLSISWTLNFSSLDRMTPRLGPDENLTELGKLFRYAKWERATTVVFVVFLVIWICTRIVYFPICIMESMLFRAPAFIQSTYRWENLTQRPIMPRFLFLMLCILFMLHVFWTYLLIKIAAKSLTNGVDDIREHSDDEEDQVDGESSRPKTTADKKTKKTN